MAPLEFKQLVFSKNKNKLKREIEKEEIFGLFDRSNAPTAKRIGFYSILWNLEEQDIDEKNECPFFPIDHPLTCLLSLPELEIEPVD